MTLLRDVKNILFGIVFTQVSGIELENSYIFANVVELIQLDAHERWLYYDTTHTQKLIRIVALCFNCHQHNTYRISRDKMI
jgi:hypothetical protein